MFSVILDPMKVLNCRKILKCLAKMRLLLAFVVFVRGLGSSGKKQFCVFRLKFGVWLHHTDLDVLLLTQITYYWSVGGEILLNGLVIFTGFQDLPFLNYKWMKPIATVKNNHLDYLSIAQQVKIVLVKVVCLNWG